MLLTFGFKYRYVGTYHQDNYALGASKVFLRESMEGALETERRDIQEVVILLYNT